VPYQAELDDRRLQIPRATRVVSLWPKVDGANVSASAATYAVYDRAGASMASGSVTPTSVDSVSRCDVTVSGASLPLAEDYRLELTFTTSGQSYTVWRMLDVVAQPFDALNSVSMNDMQDVWPDVQPMLLRQAEAQASGRTAVQQAQVLILRAWEQVRRWVRKRVETDYRDQRITAWIADDMDLRPVIVLQAIALARLADGDTASADAWSERASRAWSEVPSLRFAPSDDRVVTSEVPSVGSVTVRRGW
jgi:hypothetical protein